jgi:valyl-tRNA synthetase
MEGSVHRSTWPSATELAGLAGDGDPAVLAVAADVLRELRRAKSEAKASMRADISVATVTDGAERLAALALVADDVRDAGKVADLSWTEGEFAVAATLAPAESAESTG